MFAHVFNVPLPSLSRMFFSFILAENVGSFKTQISQKYKKNQIPGAGEKKCRRFGRGTLNTCAKFPGLTLKNGVETGM